MPPPESSVQSVPTRSPNRSLLVLTVFFLALCVVTVAWVSIDRRPPEWDHANHLERAVECYHILSQPGHDRLREIFAASSFYPPITSCAAGLLYFVFPITPLSAQAVILAFLGLALAATFALGRCLVDAETGLLAAFVVGTAPFVVYSTTNFQLDLPLMAMVAATLYTLVKTDDFSRPGWCVALGVLMGLGMLTKPPFPGYVLAVFLWVLGRALRAADRWARLRLVVLALSIGAGIALPWYGPRLLGLPMQAASRSFRFAALEGQPEYLSAESLLFYPRVLPSQLGPLATVLFFWGLWAVRRLGGPRVYLWLAGVVPFLLFSLIQNRNLRYTLPILPAAALLAAVGARSLRPACGRVVAWALVGSGLVQVSMAAFAVPPPPRVPGLPLPLVFYQPPSRADWQHEAVLADLVRAARGQPTTVAVVPNFNFFSVSNFRYEAVRRGLPFRMVRAWSDAPLGIDFVILKTGSQGPSFSVAKAERIMKAFDGGDPYLSEAFPVVGEYPLPDGSRGILRTRRIPALTGVAPTTLAGRLESFPERLLRDIVRDPVNLRLRMDYRPEALLRGFVDHVQIEADAAVVGELTRKDRAPLRIREARLQVDGLVFNPHRLMSRDQLQVFDVKKLRIEHLVVTEEDLNEFLRGQPLAGIRIELGEDTADVRVSQFGANISSRIRLFAGPPGRPFTLETEGLTISGIPVPGPFVNWIVRQFDPGPALDRLPLAVSLSPIRIRPHRVQIGE